MAQAPPCSQVALPSPPLLSSGAFKPFSLDPFLPLMPEGSLQQVQGPPRACVHGEERHRDRIRQGWAGPPHTSLAPPSPGLSAVHGGPGPAGSTRDTWPLTLGLCLQVVELDILDTLPAEERKRQEVSGSMGVQPLSQPRRAGGTTARYQGDG